MIQGAPVKQPTLIAFWAAIACIFTVGEVAISLAWAPWTWEPPIDPGAARTRDILGVMTISWAMTCVTAAIVGSAALRNRRERAASVTAYAAVVGAASRFASPPARRLDRLPPELAGSSLRASASIVVLIYGLIVVPWMMVIITDPVARAWTGGGVLVAYLATYVAFSLGGRALAYDKAAYGLWATERAWHHQASAPEVSDVWEASPFGRSEVRGFRSAIFGSLHGRRLGAGVYVSEVIPGMEASLKNISVAYARIEKRLPCVDIAPRTVADGIDVALGGPDIRVESADFNARWRVAAKHGAYAHAIVHPRLMERLLADDAIGRRIRVEGETVVVWQPGLAGTGDLERRLRLASDVAELVPAHVLAKYGDAPREALFGVVGPSDRAPRFPASWLYHALVALAIGLYMVFMVFFAEFE